MSSQATSQAWIQWDRNRPSSMKGKLAIPEAIADVTPDCRIEDKVRIAAWNTEHVWARNSDRTGTSCASRIPAEAARCCRYRLSEKSFGVQRHEASTRQTQFSRYPPSASTQSHTFLELFTQQLCLVGLRGARM